MGKFLYFLLLAAFFQFSNTVPVMAQVPDTTIYKNLEVPAYSKGMAAFRYWVTKNYRFPKKAVEARVNGTVRVNFVVEKDGSLGDIKIVEDLGYGTGEEAVRVLKKASKWTPGIQDGLPVRVQYTMPIHLDFR